MSEEIILVVDDEIANLQKLQRTFAHRYRVLTAGSGQEALVIIGKNPAVAVIVADQRMPDMTGVDLLKQSREILPHAIRIILTGYTDVNVLMDAINSCGVYRYMVKPWDPPDLLMTVERGLEAYRLARENELFKRELIRRERLSRELEIARDIQRYILPSCCPDLDRYQIGVEYHPAREVGGDLYDFEFADQTLQIVIGDVSGKSIPSALYGAVFSGQLQTLFPGRPAPCKALATLNDKLLRRYSSGNYIAVIFCRVNTADGSVVLANGGMPFPFLIHDGTVTRVEIPGVPLGLMEATDYDEMEFRLFPGDTLLLASDGATDAMDKNGRFNDMNRFIDSISRNHSKEVPDFLKSLYSDLCLFSGDVEAGDDITLLALRRLE
ncbi:MAG TPA: SpoIIE family protein phosphatase [Acidobacteriota bacterium]|nr:SpoIIE family protein phosphatase [Acidobacteriota bacterium]